MDTLSKHLIKLSQVMMIPISTLFLIGLIGIIPSTFFLAVDDQPSITIDLVVQDLCPKKVALLGEATHGDGETFQFKVELVRRLIEECHYDAFFIESGIYDFLYFNREIRSGNRLASQILGNAIGKVWSASREFKPLITFLSERAVSGGLYVGGLDDQINSTAEYAQRRLPTDLSAYLPENERKVCHLEIQKYTLWQYDSQNPYKRQDQAKILNCLRRIAGIIETERSPHQFATESLAMVKSLIERVTRDFLGDETEIFNRRDMSMYSNFNWLVNHLPDKRKIIIWLHNVHAAKILPTAKIDQKIPLGEYLSNDYGSLSYALGFSAYSGSYAMMGHPVRHLAVAPINSVEGTMHSPDARSIYLNNIALENFGQTFARPFNYVLNYAQWNSILDGLVVFHQESPPHFEH